ncbi:amino acid ABC transporter ATP-binding protein [Mesorhizobium sp. J428]|uniref:amino acid ABC transporter ATP-binding protein n=1 Tax=Mesorhizobium sp. J428 TaxID=2898440 RepID=UPI00215097FD|nr:amino acid ABC transporter ATP-binding protein [Mesorhizobium sp. J428]MCR5857215.1 amino acid ABC transporter ATP-binding protein [Mesorhizobium sp. J428]
MDAVVTHKIVVDARAVNKRFGSTHVLRDVSLEVRAGEVVCIVGPSGGGKSTFLRLVNGFETIDEGQITVDGIRLPGSRRDLLAVRRDVGMVFQSFNLFPHLSVLDNLTLAPRRTGRLDRAKAEERAHELLKRVGIFDQVAKHPSQLSGGQQQRVAIARALAMEPRLLLFDEPTSALDPENVNEVLNVMKELARSGITMIVVTHEMGFAREVADRIVFMAEGQILADAPPKPFFDNAEEPRLRAFLSKIL